MKRNPIQDIVRVNNKISSISRKDITEDIKVVHKEDLPAQAGIPEEKIEVRKVEIKKTESKPKVAPITEPIASPKINTTINPVARPIINDTTVSSYTPPREPIERITLTKSKQPKKKKLILIVFIALFLGLLYGLSVLFTHAKIYIKPKVQTFTFTDEVFKASRGSESPINFEIMIVDAEESKEMIFTETKELSTKAKGEVTIYNTYSTKPQKLLINTRLEDSKKNIYMTNKAVSVPGYTKTSAGKVVPGSIVVGITAQNAGEKYNYTGDGLDLVLFGFKGTDKATKIYAKSKGSITGGAVGTFYTPSAEEQGALSSDMSVSLRDKLEKKLEAQIPPGYIVYPGSTQFSLKFDSNNIISSTPNGKAIATATLSTILIKETDLEKAIIRNVYTSVPESEIAEIHVPEIKSLTFSYTNPSEVISKATQTISFNLKGDARLLWQPDLEALKTKILGVKKAELDGIFKQDPGIESVRVVLRPPWQKTLPEQASKVTLITE